MARIPTFNIDEGTVERISFRGDKIIDSTLMVRVGKRGISKRALLLGCFLAGIHIADGILTFFGMQIFGVAAEGNALLRSIMHVYGAATALFIAKTIAIGFTFALTFQAHRRLWLRPIIVALIVIYLIMAICPWFYIHSQYQAQFMGV